MHKLLFHLIFYILKYISKLYLVPFFGGRGVESGTRMETLYLVPKYCIIYFDSHQKSYMQYYEKLFIIIII